MYLNYNSLPEPEGLKSQNVRQPAARFDTEPTPSTSRPNDQFLQDPTISLAIYTMACFEEFKCLMEYSKAKLKSNAGDKASCFRSMCEQEDQQIYMFRIQYEKSYISFPNKQRPKCCLPRFNHVGAPLHPKWNACCYNLRTDGEIFIKPGIWNFTKNRLFHF